MTRSLVLCAAVLAALWATGSAAAYGWPVKPFGKQHPVRGAFDDPRFHLGSEGAISAFHFGVDIAARDGAKVYAVEPGYVTAHRADVTVTTRSGRGFGYWHIRPVVHTHQRVRRHQLLGYVRPGWGHVHFAESVGREYRNPLRHGALTPYRDRTPPTVASISIVSSEATTFDTRPVSGTVDVAAEIFDTPPIPPPGAWDVARLTPALVWWRLERDGQPLSDWIISIDFHFALMPATLYGSVYAAGTYQNKAHRPGKYLFWVVHDLDTTSLPNGRYSLDVLAADTRWNYGSGSISFVVSNQQQSAALALAPGIATSTRHPA